MKFVDAYKKKWGLEPEGYGTSSSYMAVYQLKDAIEKANSIDSDAVIKGLENMRYHGSLRQDAVRQENRIRLYPPSTRRKAQSPVSSSGRPEKGSRSSRRR